MQRLILTTAAVSNNDARVSFRIAIRTRLDRHLAINSSHGATSSSNGKATVTDSNGIVRRLIAAYPANDSSLTSTTSSSSVTLITRRYYVAARRGSSTPTPPLPPSASSIRFYYDNGSKSLMDHPPRSISSLFSTSYSISPIRLLSNTTVLASQQFRRRAQVMVVVVVVTLITIHRYEQTEGLSRADHQAAREHPSVA